MRPRAAATLVAVLAVFAAAGCGHRSSAPPQTTENASPPPEAFLFFYGALIGFVAVIVVRVVRWQRGRRHT